MLQAGERAPGFSSISYDGQPIDLPALGKGTILWFSPKYGAVDEYGDRLAPRWSP